MIRRRVVPPLPSDWTVQAGRLWSPDAWVNRPLDPDVRSDGEPVEVGWSCLLAGQVRAVARADRARRVAVEVHRRQVVVGDAHYDLDAVDPPVSYATGLVLAREIAAAKIEHVIAVIGPWDVGTRLCAASTGTMPEGAGEWAICDALFVYGAVCVEPRNVGMIGAAPDPDRCAVVLVEEPPGGLGWPVADVGPVYRDVGIFGPSGMLPVTLTPTRRPRYLTRWWRGR